MPRLPAPRSVTAKTIATSAVLPDVMNCLTPSITQSLPSRTATVRSAAASEPACGSVRQNAPSLRPAASGRSQRSFCSSLPQASRIEHTSELTATIVDVAPSPAATSSRTTDSDR